MIFLCLSSLHDSYSERFPRSHPLFVQTGLIKLSPFAPNFIFSSPPTELHENLYKSSHRRIPSVIDEDSGVPTLTPLQGSDNKKSSQQKFAAVVGGAGAALLVLIIVILVYFCLMRFKRLIKQASETASSAPSPPIELEGPTTSHFVGAQASFDSEYLRKLTIQEIEHATSNFSHNNIIGEGAFGFVYKGLLLDGTIVAIKRRLHSRVPNFVHKVNHIAYVQHKHLVKLIGYCNERHEQLLVYEYVSNGNVGQYLYDDEGLPTGKLDMRQRLFIASGAARGLQHLHSLVPPLLHMHFRTSNVLVDENLTAKVSDYGLSKFITEDNRPGSSSAIDLFLDPELNESKNFTAQSDVYSFGVFLLGLVSGREANCRKESILDDNLVLQAKECRDLSAFVDNTAGEFTTQIGKQMMDLALQCIDVRRKRPSMTRVVQELEQIQERKMGFLSSEDIGAVKLGSELFR